MEPRERIEAYFAACTSGTPEEIAAHFTDEAVVYDMNHRPVRGAETIGAFWSKIRAKWTGAVWRVQTCVTDGTTAAIEWSMSGDQDGSPFCVRGSEHYDFEDGRIAEIRQYWHFDPKHLESALVEFPYDEDPRFAGR